MTPLVVSLPAADVAAVLPAFVVASAALVVLVVDLVAPAFVRRYAALVLGGLGLALGAGALARGGTHAAPAFAGAFVGDGLAVVFAAIVLVAAFLSLALLAIAGRVDQVGGAVALLLWSTAGAMIMAGAASFMTVFLGLELLSLGLYALCGFSNRPMARESALKYLILSSTASAVMLFGMALIFGATASVNFADVAGPNASPSLLALGAVMFLVGIAFKLSLAPFHAWAPDVYEGAPLAVTAFMSVVTKAGALAVFVRFAAALGPTPFAHALLVPMWLVAGLSMIVGNVAALAQTDMKRLLAYSGIAQLGYLVAPLAGGTVAGLGAAVAYLVAYSFMNLGAFAVVAALSRENDEGSHIANLAALGSRRPWLAAALTIFLLGLAGLPPTAGFTAKILILAATVGAGYAWLGGLLVIGTAISVYAYLKIVRLMYAPAFGRAPAALVSAPSVIPLVALAICAVVTIVLGFHPLVAAPALAVP